MNLRFTFSNQDGTKLGLWTTLEDYYKQLCVELQVNAGELRKCQ